MKTLSHSLFPRYRYPIITLLGLVRDICLVRRRSFREDSIEFISRMEPPLNVLGRENITNFDPCLVVFNHYSRPGFRSWWIALAVASQLPTEAHFVMTNEWTFPGKWYALFGKPLSKWVLTRAARIYGFSSMPPMPPREKDISSRAQSVRNVLSYVDQNNNPVICLSPEGGDNPGGGLAVPASGVGRFIGHLASKGLRIVPAGIWEQEGYLYIRFGTSYKLNPPSGLSTAELDRELASLVMTSIARLIPFQFRGAFQ